MPKRIEISCEELEKITQARSKNKEKTVDKWLEVLELQAAGKTRKEISEKTGYDKQYITELVSEYKKKGLEEYAKKQYKGNHRNMSVAEETEIISDYKKLAARGEIVEVSAIKIAYEEKAGHAIGGGQIYRVLHRHGWRKVMPRSKHPKKASEEVIEASKKLTER